MRAMFRAAAVITATTTLAIGLTACDVHVGTSPAKRTTSSSTPATTTQVDDVGQTTHQTIADYLAELGVTDQKAEPGVDGAPELSIPTPDGWADAGDETPDYSVGAIVYRGPEVKTARYVPNVVAILSALPPGVDQDKVLSLARGELENLPEFSPFGPPTRDELDGFPALKIAGKYHREGMPAVIAQQTVVIPGRDHVYVLQLNATSAEAESEILMTATDEIDRGTEITT
ncbi:LpqN/LpqT family lipoprotein [Gordonia sp. PP30]|uniref:LpqN/LpqT family lipoprotein n=1 Tax=Gordonia sp. PP30 TaxID=2935861 RepID=UPI001FFF5F18|nr:LpqN/LpqT family lipoprotein [Gordonia sp. PP30]UQE76147.1 LpqN/LpqT family lipoprotein [Gordonia sp. PP30]